MPNRKKSPSVEIKRIHNRGVYAGITGKSIDMCPYAEQKTKRSTWIEGWRIGREQHTIKGNERQQRKSIRSLKGS